MKGHENERHVTTGRGRKEDDTSNLQLLEPTEQKGRARAAWQEWQVRNEDRDTINDSIALDFREDVDLGHEPPAKRVPLAYRQRKIRELFQQLPDDEREVWANAVIEEKNSKEEMKKTLEENLKNPSPEQRQACVFIPVQRA